MADKNMIYLDNNATTIMPPPVVNSMIDWVNKGNPSASYKTAQKCRELMEEYSNFIAKSCGFTLYKGEGTKVTPMTYQIIYTSGASESNSHILQSVVLSVRCKTNTRPHVVSSSMEHKSVLLCLKSLADRRLCDLTFVHPDQQGHIPPHHVSKALRPNTCLVCVMSGNNETGALMDTKEIGRICHENRVPYFSDMVQTYGKFIPKPVIDNIDALSFSAHKFYGPAGFGALIIKRQWIESYCLSPLVYGTQNCSMRGGTENIPALAAAYTANRLTWDKRAEKNMYLFQKRNILKNVLQNTMPTTVNHSEYMMRPIKNGLVFLTEGMSAPNTLLVSVIGGDKVCNNKMKKALENAGIIVSVGSACNTNDKNASHVLTALQADAKVRRGTIRISLSDFTTMDDITTAANKIASVFLMESKKP